MYIQLEKHQIIVCENCGSHSLPEDVIPLPDVTDLHLRLEPGSVVPAGECPECNCFAYIQTKTVKLADGARTCPECGGETFERKSQDNHEGEITERGVLDLYRETVLNSGPIICSGCKIEIDCEDIEIRY